MRVTIKDIARETGLSLATISKYLNNKKIREENRLLIEQAIHRLNYRPNHSAQTLRSKHTMTVAILISDLGNYFWGTIISSVSQYFVKYNYTVITCSFYYDLQKEREMIHDLIVRNIDGVIMLPYNAHDNLYHLLQEADIPVVVLDQNLCALHPQPVDCVISDNYAGGALLGRYLLKKGHRRIHIMEQADRTSTIPARVKGFQDVFEQAGLAPPAVSPPITFSTDQNTINFCKKHFYDIMESAQPPTAIFFTNYLSALGGLTEASASCYPIPEDISIVVFDDDPLFRCMFPPITTVAQNLSLIGETASELLYRRMQGDYTDFPLTACIDVDFYERQSVKDLN